MQYFFSMCISGFRIQINWSSFAYFSISIVIRLHILAQEKESKTKCIVPYRKLYPMNVKTFARWQTRCTILHIKCLNKHQILKSMRNIQETHKHTMEMKISAIPTTITTKTVRFTGFVMSCLFKIRSYCYLVIEFDLFSSTVTVTMAIACEFVCLFFFHSITYVCVCVCVVFHLFSLFFHRFRFGLIMMYTAVVALLAFLLFSFLIIVSTALIIVYLY